jgi:cobalamin biosynthetic protein CobC
MNTLQSDDSVDAPPDVYHGGDLAAAHVAFPNAPRPWLDLSTGINPNSYPLPEMPLDAWRRLPGRERVSELERIATARYGAAENSRVVAGPGIQAFIQILPRLRRAERIGVLGFTYLEYERVWQSAGVNVQIVATLDELRAFDIAVVVNPNNPDGRLIAADRLAGLASEMAKRGGLLIVDEAFMDPLPVTHSVARLLSMDSILVLRSFGKMYGLAGIRLGFAITAPSIAQAMTQLLGPWSVSGPAIEVGIKALSDKGWLDTAITDLNTLATKIDAVLISHGLSIVGGTPLFRLVAHSNAQTLFSALGRHGILVRPFSKRPKLLRFGLPGTEHALIRLRMALERIDA